MNRSTIRWSAAAVVGLASATAAGAQQGPRSDAAAGRYTLQGYLARYALDDGLRTGTQSPGGVGARLTFNRPDERGGRGLADRATGAAFATFTANQGAPSLNTLHLGVETDVPILPRPLAGVLDPFFSIGLGIFRTSIANASTASGPKRINRSDLALTPGVGTRIPFFNGIGARGDLRAPFVFGFSTTANVVAEGGLYVTF